MRLRSLCKLEMDAELLDARLHASETQAASTVHPTLCDVIIRSMFPLFPLRFAEFAAQIAPQLTSLWITGEPVNSVLAARCTVEDLTGAWASLLPALSRCTRLQRLRLGQMSSVHTDEHVVSHSTRLAAALRPLAALTELRLGTVDFSAAIGDHRCRLHGRPLGGVLATLTALCSLRICSGEDGSTLEMLEPEHVLDACTALTQLSRLGLCMATAQELPLRVAELIPRLPALKVLLFRHSTEALEALKARYPNIQIDTCGCADCDSDT